MHRALFLCQNPDETDSRIVSMQRHPQPSRQSAQTKKIPVQKELLAFVLFVVNSIFLPSPEYKLFSSVTGQSFLLK